jgi:hypothetical protein
MWSVRIPSDFTETTTVSPATTVLLSTVNVAVVAEPAAENSVIAPVRLFSVTVVVRLVSWVTVPPAPVA